MREPRHQPSIHDLLTEQEKEELAARAEEIRKEARERREARSHSRRQLLERYSDEELAEIGVRDREAASRCDCSCHPQPGDRELHSGNLCACQQTAEEQQQLREKMLADIAQIGQDQSEEWQQRREDLQKVADQLGVEVDEEGGFAPYQLMGRVDGIRFYLRERHGHWELRVPDMQAGDDGDPVGIENGTLVIDEGDERELYSESDPHAPLRRAVESVREHLRRRSCTHPESGRYCRECGARTGSSGDRAADF